MVWRWINQAGHSGSRLKQPKPLLSQRYSEKVIAKTKKYERTFTDIDGYVGATSGDCRLRTQWFHGILTSTRKYFNNLQKQFDRDDDPYHSIPLPDDCAPEDRIK